MKSLIPVLVIAVVIIAFLGGLWLGRPKPTTRDHPLRLEEILSVKELHLVKHVYQDLFFVHKKNDPSKSIRAIVQVPVEITAYLNLKEIQIVYQKDSIRQIILPRAYLNAPHYKIDQMVVSKTHKFQIHAGKDLYPEVGGYLSEILKERSDSVRNLAVANRILTQAEAEGKAYVESLLIAASRSDIRITFGDEATDRQIISYMAEQQKQNRMAFISMIGNE